LSLLVNWFLTQQTTREIIRTAALMVPRVRRLIVGVLTRLLGCHRVDYSRRTEAVCVCDQNVLTGDS
jgi:hypothetical protein